MKYQIVDDPYVSNIIHVRIEDQSITVADFESFKGVSELFSRYDQVILDLTRVKHVGSVFLGIIFMLYSHVEHSDQKHIVIRVKDPGLVEVMEQFNIHLIATIEVDRDSA